jgi:opacity protein-like surface antigen
MRKLIGGTALVAALALVPALLPAQGMRFGAGVGLLMPLGDYGTADKMGWVVGADATKWMAGSILGIRVEGSYSQTSHDGASGNFKIIGGMADLVYAFGLPAAHMRPYALGGLGYYNVKESVSGTSESKVGFGLGAGLAFKMGAGSTRLFVEGKWTTVSTTGASTSFVPIRVGLRFGGK